MDIQPQHKKHFASGLITVGVILIGISIYFAYNYLKPKENRWKFESIDTMKYSRDLSREKLHDESFDKTIDLQVKQIADSGATHVGIATPYDEEFLPILKKWVIAARSQGLKVWFRGNFSGWEGWFGYPKISRDEHLKKTREFITSNAGLFEDGDVFSPCPECENGGPGDPRKNGDVVGGLKVWFRGNFSGWEGWFGYPKISRDEHLKKTREFITSNAGLFEDGDVFSPCPECENGGPGDPRKNGDVVGHRKFLISEYNATSEEFKKIGKNVTSNYSSMNFDVAKLVMNKATTKSMGGIVTIDHYVKTPQQLSSDITHLAQLSGGKVILGEFGAPIPDINGNMSEVEQAEWVRGVLELLSENTNVIGLNYWINTGGSTEIWRKDGTSKAAAVELKSFFDEVNSK
jgi:uncharacterized protein YbbK (DUF523 family)